MEGNPMLLPSFINKYWASLKRAKVNCFNWHLGFLKLEFEWLLEWFPFLINLKYSNDLCLKIPGRDTTEDEGVFWNAFCLCCFWAKQVWKCVIWIRAGNKASTNFVLQLLMPFLSLTALQAKCVLIDSCM